MSELDQYALITLNVAHFVVGIGN